MSTPESKSNPFQQAAEFVKSGLKARQELLTSNPEYQKSKQGYFADLRRVKILQALMTEKLYDKSDLRKQLKEEAKGSILTSVLLILAENAAHVAAEDLREAGEHKGVVIYKDINPKLKERLDKYGAAIPIVGPIIPEIAQHQISNWRAKFTGVGMMVTEAKATFEAFAPKIPASQSPMSQATS